MIINVPSFNDFIDSGTDFLNLAWSSAINLAIELENARVEEWDTDGEVSDEYWQAAQHTLATAISLAEQGTEFLLKARIVRVSPFLLIAGNPTEWPRGCDKNDTAFADFKTIDAQDLIRAHNTVAQQRLSGDFTTRCESLRRLRNAIMHTVDKRTRIIAKDALLTILEVNHEIGEAGRWIQIRRQFLEHEPASVAYSSDHVEYGLSREITATIEMLAPAEAKKHFDFAKRQRRYFCPNCSTATSDFDEQPKLAQLRPNAPDSTNLYCILCGQNRQVIRKDCKHKDCRGNVIDEETKECLTCGRWQ